MIAIKSRIMPSAATDHANMHCQGGGGEAISLLAVHSILFYVNGAAVNTNETHDE
jgi:hypothetical protein